jgi:peptidyl-prolyl cis-trans isomerase B (cyclophilin B)
MNLLKTCSALLLGWLLCFNAQAATKTNPSTHAQKGKHSMVKLHTNHGDITIELDAEKAPVSVKNFLDYASSGFYDGTIFHRVMGNFMIQGGGFEPGMKQKPTHDPIQNEAKNGLSNQTYTVAMARTNAPHSATAQFFINVTNNDFLDYPGQDGWGYAVFGKVVEGMDVVDKIKNVKTGNKGMHQNVPLEDVIITKAEVLK